jgi:predicted ATPase
MQGSRMLRSLRLTNLLSYGSHGASIDLEPLNVLIGPNASGKSNLIEAISLLAATPKDLLAPIREGGGAGEWIWKGKRQARAELEATIDYPDGLMPLRYRLAFTMIQSRLEIMDEVIENNRPGKGGAAKPYSFYAFQNGRPVINLRTKLEDKPGTEADRIQRTLKREDISPEQSILSQRKDADQYPEITYLGNQFGRIRLYREWNMGRYTPARMAQKADLPEDFLLEDYSNLGLVLNDLQNRAETKLKLLQKLRLLYEGLEDVTTKVQAGTVQVLFHEKGLKTPVPAMRQSDGTLRYLCLLLILCHPSPPPLVCIEEPELGLHPDALPVLAELLAEAANRAQFIVTTHSDALISALSDVPEAVIVCERGEDGTTLRPLDPPKLAEWLNRYKLGELWRMGEIGGTRW